jgi:hypothetical protein
MPKENITTAEPIALRKNGDLVLQVDGKDEVIAHYDRKTSDLEYATEKISKLHARGCAFAIGTTNKGKSVSGLTIKTFGVKGKPRDDVSKAPPMPKKDPNLGDLTDALVKWYFAWKPQEAYVRYGVYMDADGQPVRRKVRRKWKEFIDDRADGLYGLEDRNDGKGIQIGKGKFEKSAVAELKSIEEFDDQIIARRPSCMTFHPNEVVGGFDASDDSDEQMVTAEPEEVEGGE